MRSIARPTLIGVVLVMNLTIGLGVTPVLFAEMPDRALAGSIAGILFERAADLSLLLIGLSFFLAGISARQKSISILLALAMAMTAVGRFWVAPMIASLRSAIHLEGGMERASLSLQHDFKVMHGVSSTLFLLCLACLIATLILEWRGRRS